VGAAGCGSGSSSSTTATAPPARSATTARTPAPRSPAESSPGSSITGYGAAAHGSGKAAVTAAAHSFFTAMARGDYAGVCAGLAASNRKQIAQFAKLRHEAATGCAASLAGLLSPAAAAEARKAAEATIGKVRIKGGTAFVIFRPKGGVPSYFVMRKEGGGWKAISLAPGTPIDPTATP
jgi:hypothetical protein